MSSWKVVVSGALILGSVCMNGCMASPGQKSGPCYEISGAPYEIVSVAAHPHIQVVPRSSRGFTQGLFFRNGRLFESTGLAGSSELRELEPDTGEIIRSVKLPKRLFGEGAVEIDGQVLVGTWKNKKILHYDLESFTLVREAEYPNDIWGLTTNGTVIFVSDGSSTLRLVDRESLQPVGEVEVTLDGVPLSGLNELEWVQGNILANVWPTGDVYRIDAAVGTSVKIVDAKIISFQFSGTDNPENVMNGIAFDETAKRLLFTGKNWDSFMYYSVC